MHNASGVYLTLGQQAQAANNPNEARLDWQKVIALAPGSTAAFKAQEYISASTAQASAPFLQTV